MRDQIRVVMLAELDPAGTARGEMRQLRLLLRQAHERLARLLHDRDVRARAGVEHRVEPERPERCDLLRAHDGAGREAELLAERNLRRGRRLHDDVFLIVRERRLDLLYGWALRDRSRRAPERALPAADARRFILDGQRIVAVDAHHFLTRLDALAAENAFLIVAHDGGVVRRDGDAPLELRREIATPVILVRHPAVAARLLLLTRTARSQDAETEQART